MGHYLDSFFTGNELHITEIGFYGTRFGQAPWKFLLSLCNKDAVEFNSHYVKFISSKKESNSDHRYENSWKPL